MDLLVFIICTNISAVTRASKRHRVDTIPIIPISTVAIIITTITRPRVTQRLFWTTVGCRTSRLSIQRRRKLNRGTRIPRKRRVPAEIERVHRYPMKACRDRNYRPQPLPRNPRYWTARRARKLSKRRTRVLASEAASVKSMWSNLLFAYYLMGDLPSNHIWRFLETEQSCESSERICVVSCKYIIYFYALNYHRR